MKYLQYFINGHLSIIYAVMIVWSHYSSPTRISIININIISVSVTIGFLSAIGIPA